MGIKSEAQRRKLKQLVADGTISQEKYDEYEAKTKGALPERKGTTPLKTGLRRPKYILRRPK